jgi:transcriptional regulator with GAF, ATPase, and Fis domain
MIARQRPRAGKCSRARGHFFTTWDAAHRPRLSGDMTKKGNVAQHLRNEEREAIESALRLSRGRIAGPKGAANRLGLPASTLEFRIKRLGINKFAFR